MYTVSEIETYVDSNILHSAPFDKATATDREKAVNQATLTLQEQLNVEDVAIRDVAEQAVYLFKLDNTLQRAELGVESVSIDGISISMADIDRTLAPTIKNRYGISTTKKRRVGSYSMPIHDSYRKGQPYPRQHY